MKQIKIFLLILFAVSACQHYEENLAPRQVEANQEEAIATAAVDSTGGIQWGGGANYPRRKA